MAVPILRQPLLVLFFRGLLPPVEGCPVDSQRLGGFAELSAMTGNDGVDVALRSPSGGAERAQQRGAG